MGVRLVRYKNGLISNGDGSTGTYDHNELLNRDLIDQHPISAITGLQDMLDNISSILEIIKEKSSNSNIITVQQDKHGLNIGHVVYLKSDGLYDKAFGEDSERIEVVGIVTSVSDENNFVITVSGEFQTDIYDNYSDGTVLYLSDSDGQPGTLTDIPKRFIKPIAIKINTGVLINIQRANMEDPDDSMFESYTEEEIFKAIDELW